LARWRVSSQPETVTPAIDKRRRRRRLSDPAVSGERRLCLLGCLGGRAPRGDNLFERANGVPIDVEDVLHHPLEGPAQRHGVVESFRAGRPGRFAGQSLVCRPNLPLDGHQLERQGIALVCRLLQPCDIADLRRLMLPGHDALEPHEQHQLGVEAKATLFNECPEIRRGHCATRVAGAAVGRAMSAQTSRSVVKTSAASSFVTGCAGQ
jgi:hypothetical protein